MLLSRPFLFTLIFVFSSLVFAGPATVKVNWSNPDNYKDIQADSGESDQTFRQRLADNFQSHLDQLAADLPQDATLEMTFTDLDLAGQIRISGAGSGHKDVRVIKDGYRPQMNFSYKLSDASGQLLKQGEENLKSPMSVTRVSPTSQNRPFEIEKKMLSNWFKKTLL